MIEKNIVGKHEPYSKEKRIESIQETYDNDLMSIYKYSSRSERSNKDIWIGVSKFIDVMHDAVLQAYQNEVSSNTIQKRLKLLIYSWSYAVDAFSDIHLPKNDVEISEWIPSAMDIFVAKNKNEVSETIESVSSILAVFHGSTDELLRNITKSFYRFTNPRQNYEHFIHRFPKERSSPCNTVEYWDINENSFERILGIDGYDRTGPVALRRIMNDFQKLRRKKFYTIFSFGNDQVVTADSWMFENIRKIEQLFGESFESLTNKGFQWSGPISIQDMDTSGNKFPEISSQNRVIASSLYALMLRDDFIKKFITYGMYPTVGTFRMPRNTFQNFQPTKSYKY